MKKYILLLAILFVSSSILAQEQKEVKLEKKGDLTEATYYHENGEISQKGTFDFNGNLDGVWKQYDEKGNKIAVGTYVNGKKEGKWLFWSDGSLKEVDFENSKIVNVKEWQDKQRLALRN